MLFSRLLRVSTGSFGTTNQGSSRFLSGLSKPLEPLTLRPSSTCSPSSDKLCHDLRHGNQQKGRMYFYENDDESPRRIPNHVQVTKNRSFSNWIYSSQAVILSQSRTLSPISSSLLPMSIRPEATPSCSIRLMSSQGKGGDKGESCGTDGVCEPPIKEVRIKDGFQTRDSVNDFLAHLTDDQKKLLYHSLNIEVLRDKYEGHLGSSATESHQFLSKFGRPAAAIGGKEDPTGTLCEIPPKWLHARLDEQSRPVTAGAIWAVGLKNALPFIGFGFLDNFIMIVMGDYIDITIGTTLGISTMAAAALGNTISDVAGIGSAWYIEEFASKIGIKDPELTPSQAASWSVRWACNGGRALGVVIGCLLGMVPLLFLPSSEDDKEKLALSRAKRAEEQESTKTGKDSAPKDKN